MTTALAIGSLGDVETRRAGRSEPTTVEVIRGLEGAVDLWRAFEGDAVMTPYGRYDWVAAYQACLPDAVRDTRIAIVRDARGEVVLLAPFQLERRLGVSIATAIGGKHSNYALPVMRPDFAAGLGVAQAGRILAEAGRLMGADIVAMPRSPVAWEGWPNPFAEGGRPSASNAWALALDATGEATLARSMSADARKKMRSKARGLAKIGQAAVTRARTPAEVDGILDAFHRQKAERFDGMGIADPFAQEAARLFLRDAATTRLAEDGAAVELYALTVDAEIVAVLGGAADGRRFGGMVVSFQSGPLERYSLGEMLISGAIADLCARGYRMFDLGAGDSRYKRGICDQVEALVDVTMPLTAKGRIAAFAQGSLLEAKRRIKADPRAMALVGGARRFVRRFGGRPA